MTHGVHLVGIAAFFLFGLAGSLHCLGMCGPLSTALLTNQSKGWSGAREAYHLSRILSYGLLGALLNAAGITLQKKTNLPILILLVLLPLLLYGFGFSLPAPRFLFRFQQGVFKKIRNLNPLIKGSVVGTLSPLLPCGLLYGALISSLAAPSPASAALWMAAFASGTIPLLVFSQVGLHRLTRHWSPRYQSWMSRSMAFLAAGIIIYMNTASSAACH